MLFYGSVPTGDGAKVAGELPGHPRQACCSRGLVPCLKVTPLARARGFLVAVAAQRLCAASCTFQGAAESCITAADKRQRLLL